MDTNELLFHWKRKFELANNEYHHSLANFHEQEQIYLGTRIIDKGVNNKIGGPVKSASNVRNIAFELIESQIDSSIPLPKVDALTEDNEHLAKKIEDSLKADISRLSFESLNDSSERITPIHGMSIFEVMWDVNHSMKNINGELKIRLIHPKQFIPQSGVYNIQDMDYFFVLNSVTKKQLSLKYNIDEALFDDVNDIFTNGLNNSELLTEIVCWYKNDDGLISRFSFCNDIVLEDIDNYYARYVYVCTKCSQVRNPLEDSCVCGNDSFTQKIMDYEVLNVGGRSINVSYYVPDVYPFVMRLNVPLTFSFGGQSDIDVIKDQQNAIKKLYSKVEEKIIKGGSVIEVPESMRNRMSITDEELKIIYKKPTDPPVNVFTIQPDISKDLLFIQDQIKSAQFTLGINDSFQGKSDQTAVSGYAKKLLIQQASGRLRSKQFNKFKAYKELFEIMFKFKLAFTDIPVPFVSLNSNGKKSYHTFNKYDFISSDELNNFYFTDEFLFSVDSAGGLPDDRSYMYDQTLNLYRINGYGQIGSYPALLRLWESLESLNFPMSSKIKNEIEEEMANINNMNNNVIVPNEGE